MLEFKKSIASNYVSQFYVTFIGILMVPYYVKYMGAEAYGLVGFYVMLQGWFVLLDVGITATLVRETARYRAGSLDPATYRVLFGFLEKLFFAIACLGGLALALFSEQIAQVWLKPESLSASTVATCIQLTSLIVALRWMTGLYKGLVTGMELLTWLASFNAVFATLRFACIVPVLVYYDSGPVTFFLYQLLVSLAELIVILVFGRMWIPKSIGEQDIAGTLRELRPIIKFSFSIAFASTVWVLLTQVDKLVLSKTLSLSDYGRFVLATLAASGVTILSGPVSSSILPRMSKLMAENKKGEMLEIYRGATQFVAVLAGAATVTLVVCAESFLWAWTGDRELAQSTAPILALFVAGNGILTLAAFPYYLQYSIGDLRLHVIGNCLFLLIFVPTVIYASVNYGALGAGYTWLGMNLVVLLAWLPWVHSKFFAGLNWNWYIHDIAMVIIPMCILGCLLYPFIEISDSRLIQIAKIGAIASIIICVGAVCSSRFRLILQTNLFRRLNEKT